MGDAHLDLGHSQLLDHLLDSAADGHHRFSAEFVADLERFLDGGIPESAVRDAG